MQDLVPMHRKEVIIHLSLIYYRRSSKLVLVHLFLQSLSDRSLQIQRKLYVGFLSEMSKDQ